MIKFLLCVVFKRFFLFEKKRRQGAISDQIIHKDDDYTVINKPDEWNHEIRYDVYRADEVGNAKEDQDDSEIQIQMAISRLRHLSWYRVSWFYQGYQVCPLKTVRHQK